MRDWIEIDREPLKASISLPMLNLLSRGEVYDHEILDAAAVRSANVRIQGRYALLEAAPDRKGAFEVALAHRWTTAAAAKLFADHKGDERPRRSAKGNGT
jgi:hypothetical protein